MILDNIKKENDIKSVDPRDYSTLAGEIRDFLIENVSRTGGHLAPNLGVVELTMALHIAFTLPQDKIVWDVGHQSYTHKILTGRKKDFTTLRKYGGLSGFPKTAESPCDVFNTGHSSNSISAALGLVKARELKGKKNSVVAVIGDGALTGGMAYEALNNAAKLESNLIIVLNDNEFSISENVGGMSKYLGSIRTSNAYLGLRDGVYNTLQDIPRYGAPIVKSIRWAKNAVKQMVIPGMLFENLGITYLGPVDGHDIDQLLMAIKDAKRARGAVLIHAKTQKGRGFEPAIRHPARFHGTGPFEIETGLLKNKKLKADYSDIFSTVMVKLGARDERVVAVTAAMPDGVGLKRFKGLYPDRFVDVGIAEGHAVTFCAGLAAEGLRPVFAVYSSFLQRAYDQLMEDVCLQNLPVIFAIDRAGLVGSDGETHQGAFDISYLCTMPNMTVMSPKNKWELSDMLKFALTLNSPVAIRYPRGRAYDGFKENREPVSLGRPELLFKGTEICIIALGNMVELAADVRDKLMARGYNPTLVNARFAKPLDKECLYTYKKEYSLIVTLEDNILSGGFGERVLQLLEATPHIGTDSVDQPQPEIPPKNNPETVTALANPPSENALGAASCSVLSFALPDKFIPHGSVEELRRELSLDSASVSEKIISTFSTLRK